MQFQLPSNLQTELIAYDPQLKALARQQKAKQSKTKKSKYPLGNVPHLIPYSVIRESLQQDVIDNINSLPAPDRIRQFKTPVDVATPQARTITKAIIYHYEQCWYAAWLPPKGEDYVYGYAYAFKDTPTIRKGLPGSIKSHIDDYESISVGRTNFLVCRSYITTQDIVNGKTQAYWRADYLTNYHQKSKVIAPIVNAFRDSLKETIPYWDDSRDMFDRVKCQEIWQALEINKQFIPEDKQNGWQPTVDNLFDVCNEMHITYGVENYRFYEYDYIRKMSHVLNKPYFRKWMQQELQQCVDAFNNPECKYQYIVKRGLNRIKKLAENMLHIQRIWPDCPIDYYQNNITNLLSTKFRHTRSDTANQWLCTHMAVGSFFTMLDKFHEQQKDDKWTWSKDLDCHVYSFTDWNDTHSMLEKILDVQETLEPPKRWRIADFHDYVQAEAWKISNPNETLPQDLFPEPIKVQVNNETWAFFQPHDTHQLGMWGQAVRNCVGSATGYAEGVRKKQHFIVLCMIDNKPVFTIQLKVSNGMMSVDQIRGLSNSILRSTDKERYTDAFKQALQARESALTSA